MRQVGLHNLPDGISVIAGGRPLTVESSIAMSRSRQAAASGEGGKGCAVKSNLVKSAKPPAKMRHALYIQLANKGNSAFREDNYGRKHFDPTRSVH